MKKVVIVGSASMQERINYWKSFWENNGLNVINYPAPILESDFMNEYPKVHKDFFIDMINANIVFIMNEDKNDIVGYIGAESFAEMAFAVTDNLMNGKNKEIILLKMPSKNNHAYREVYLWLKLGWIKLWE